MKLPKRPDIVTLDTFTLEDILESIRFVGTKCGKNVEAERVVSSLESRVEKVKDRLRNCSK